MLRLYSEFKALLEASSQHQAPQASVWSGHTSGQACPGTRLGEGDTPWIREQTLLREADRLAATCEGQHGQTQQTIIPEQAKRAKAGLRGRTSSERGWERQTPVRYFLRLPSFRSHPGLLKFLWCGPLFKVFIEFVTISFLFYPLVFWLRSMQDLSSPTRDWTHTPCTGGPSLNHWTARAVLHFLSFLLRYSSFTTLCEFQVTSKVIQFIYMYIYTHVYISNS